MNQYTYWIPGSSPSMTEKPLFVKSLIKYLFSFFYHHTSIPEAWLFEEFGLCIAVPLRQDIVDFEGRSGSWARRLVAMYTRIERCGFEK